MILLLGKITVGGIFPYKDNPTILYFHAIFRSTRIFITLNVIKHFFFIGLMTQTSTKMHKTTSWHHFLIICFTIPPCSYTTMLACAWFLTQPIYILINNISTMLHKWISYSLCNMSAYYVSFHIKSFDSINHFNGWWFMSRMKGLPCK